MSAYNSATVVLKVVRLILVDSKKIREPLVFLLFSFLGSAMKITIARCEDLSLLFLNAASGIATNLGSPWSGQNISSIGSPTICLQSLLSVLQSPMVGAAAAEAQRENW